MLAIKKVAVSHIDEANGAVIDSFSTLDDKHTNAPSINATENYISVNCYPKNNIHVFEGTMQLNNGVIITASYPSGSGFTQTNCFVTSAMLAQDGTNDWIYNWGTYHLTVQLDRDGIRAWIADAPSSGTDYIKFKIVIMKV